ncbi:MAG TPA: hypothetical protein VK308_15210 [Pyrinomonadaceae bacterium]|nr:hypothetical protein [Pyrinomonadaceae bacterium]
MARATTRKLKETTRRDNNVAARAHVQQLVSRVSIFSTPFIFTQLCGKRGASLVSKLRAADLNLFKKRLTAEFTERETGNTQAKI